MSKSHVNIPKSPLYDPKSKIKKYILHEDIEAIRLSVKGTKLGLFTDHGFDYDLDSDKEWRRPKEICDNPIFVEGKPDRFDALQGYLGDCWLVVGIEMLSSHEELFNHVVPSDQSFGHNYLGAFHFRIWQLGTWYDVVVDDRLPVFKKDRSLCYIRSRKGNIFWGALLEKAYAKICTESKFSYINLEYGFPTTAFQDLSGGIVEKVQTIDHINTNSIKWYLNEVFSQNALVGCACKPKIAALTGLMSGHGYAVTRVFKCDDDDPDYPGFFLVRILNPWGEKEWEGSWSDEDYDKWKQIDKDVRDKIHVDRNDGEFWMNEKDFCTNFKSIFICHLGPGQYQASRVSENLKTWKTKFFKGEWVKGISAGGSKIPNRHKNPQCRISLKLSENDTNNDGLCTVVMELTQRSKEARRKKYRLGLYVYSLSKSGNIPEPLDQNFFKTNNPLNSCNFGESDSRAYLTSIQLEPGEFCIVPCTQNKDKESLFLLRVFSESVNELWEYDTQISKCPKLEETPKEPCDEMKTRFKDVTVTRGEIDWIEIKEILKTMMNPKITYFGIILSFWKMMSNVFSKYLLFQSTDNYDTRDVEFSKDECRAMIAMLDTDQSGKLSFSEFSDLWSKIHFWADIYESHKDEVDGCVKVSHLRDALGSIGYDVNKRTVHSLSFVYANEQGNISLTDFILCGVTLWTVLNKHEKNFLQDKNKIIFNLEEWLKNTLFI